jgi:NhaP-type Na+/H+ or K+/H+ antiporter
MPSPESIGSALLLTLALMGISIVVVGLAMWWLHRVFRNKDQDSE